MAPAATRRTVLAGGTALLTSRAAAQQTTTFKLYSLGWEIDAAMLASEVPRRPTGTHRAPGRGPHPDPRRPGRFRPALGHLESPGGSPRRAHRRSRGRREPSGDIGDGLGKPASRPG